MLLAQIYEDQCRKPRDFSPMSHSREVLVQQRDPLTFWNEDPENFWAAAEKKERRGATTLIDIQSVAAYKLWKRGGPLRQKSSRVWSIFLFRRCSCCSYAAANQATEPLYGGCWCVPLVRWRDHRLAMASPRSQRTVSLSQLSTRQAVLCLFWKIHSLEKL